MTLGPLAFAAPWILGALIVLPVIYWLLRVTPPAPVIERFPAIGFLRDLVAREETPHRMPWWLLALRLLLAALVIVALAQPVLNPAGALPGGGPLIVVVDNGWASATDWPARQQALDGLIDRAARNDRRLVLVATAPERATAPIEPSGLLMPAEARGHAEALVPRPWPTDRTAALRALNGLELPGSAHAVWLSNGLDGPDARALAERLQRFGSAERLVPGPDAGSLVLRPPQGEGDALVAEVARAGAGPAREVRVQVTAEDGRLLDHATARFDEGGRRATLRLTMPTALRNEAHRMAIAGEQSAGAVVLMDERWRRRPVGLVAPPAEEVTNPILSDSLYPGRALAPFADLRRGSVTDLVEAGMAVLLLPDAAAPGPADRAALESWVAGGGVLVRFAGPLLAANPDSLVPVPLRYGDRALGGALSWSEPMPLAPFPEDSPFAGLAVPEEVRVDRQVLAEPGIDLADRTWARLADGTPLVTGRQEGEGWLVLVHTTAGPEWSDLSLSGLFVDMLRRLVALSAGRPSGDSAAPLPPLALLDGFGRLADPPAGALPLRAAAMDDAMPGPAHPPGFYGREGERRAFNLGGALAPLRQLDPPPSGMPERAYGGTAETGLMPWLLAAAVLLATLDALIALALRGLLPRWRPGGREAGRRGAATAALLAAALGMAGTAMNGAGPASAQDASLTVLANRTHLGYVLTGLPQVDEASRAGLEGLSDVLRRRTAAEPAGAVGVDPALDDLAFFPLLYWPLAPEQPTPSASMIAGLNDYLRHGGIIILDTGSRGAGADLRGARLEQVRRLTEGLAIPPLVPLPPEHVLTRAFYLLQDFPGRYAGGGVWVAAGDEHVHDGVSSVIVGGNDWASAWAVDATGQPLYPAVPGGERQREIAYRVGVNLVMYALTGNYKADQVHLPAILERLGQ